jgi:NAD(P)-dependent dehydrogenase (short-subunit alcohol dehydrogenase family)
MRRFTDKTVLVTGGGSGIGRATALAFADEGAIVVVAGRTEGKLAETVRLIEEKGAKGGAVRADLTSATDVERLIQTTVSSYGGLDVAVNNGGILAAAGPLSMIDDNEFVSVLTTNITGTWRAMKHQIAYMAEHGGGTIVNVSSSVGPHMTVPYLGAYGASKAAISSLTRTAAREYIGAGIRINAVSPGPIDTPMSLLAGETSEQRAERLREAIPLGRVGTVQEVANTVLWLASPESSYAVGIDIVLDGGGRA